MRFCPVCCSTYSIRDIDSPRQGGLNAIGRKTYDDQSHSASFAFDLFYLGNVNSFGHKTRYQSIGKLIVSNSSHHVHLDICALE